MVSLPLPYPKPTSTAVSKRMRRNPRRDTAPEIALRSALHAQGVRFRKDLPVRLASRVVRPDIAFARARVAVFVDGCFWHRCPLHGDVPRANSEYWGPKLERNVERDRIVDRALAEEGWTVVRAWEHEPVEEASSRVVEALEAARTRPAGRASPSDPSALPS